MRPTIVAPIIALILTACGGSSKTTTATPASVAQAAPKGLQIKLATIYVDDQDKALRFYTQVLGFAKKDDESNSGYRWLTVTAPGDANGTALQLALNDNPVAKTFQEARFAASEPAAMFATSDIKADYERIKAAGAEFTMPPTEVMPGATIATLKDSCGNLIQLTQLDR
jgi:predicted enzyme related to lactoylglutathione lyase